MDVAALTQAAVERFIREEVAHLADEAKRQQAMAGLCVLLTQLQESSVPDELVAAIPTIMQFIEQSGETADRDLQANACAVLSGLMAVSDDIQERVLSAGVVSRARALLAEVASGEQRTLQLNALACLAEALRDREAQAEALVQEGGLEPVLSLCRPDLPARLQEAAADVVCALACAEASRGPLSEQGAVTKLAGLLATENHDVRVRALMGLGMLLPQRGPNQVALAGDAAAVGLLLGLMRQTEDLDCRSIARDLFAGLASNPESKDLIAAAMRA